MNGPIEKIHWRLDETQVGRLWLKGRASFQRLDKTQLGVSHIVVGEMEECERPDFGGLGLRGYPKSRASF